MRCCSKHCNGRYRLWSLHYAELVRIHAAFKKLRTSELFAFILQESVILDTMDLLSVPFFILGAIIASFMAVIAERLYTGESWVKGRSRCNSCSRELSVLDLVPVLSWIVSQGRCRTCKAKVPVLYTISEATLGTLFLLAYVQIGFAPALIPFLLMLATLTFIVLYDLRHTIVPPMSSFLLIVFALLYALLASSSLQALGLTLMLAGVVSFGFFLLYALSRGRAMGLGDAPVAFALALVAGSASAIAGLLFSFWIGAVVGIFILVRTPKGHRMGIEVPFVPFLAAGYLLAYFTQWNPLLLTF